MPSPDADEDDEAVAVGTDAAELEAEADTAWTGRLLATKDETVVGAAEVGVVSEPELPLGTQAAEAEDRARARAAICLIENISEVFSANE